jgi:cytosine/uracil/thiamine/allantoin permease
MRVVSELEHSQLGMASEADRSGSTMLHAIFPGIANVPNKMGSGSALTSGGMIGYVLFWYDSLLAACRLPPSTTD